MSKAYYVYMLASRRYGTIYTGVTSDLIKRTWQHKEGFVEGFTKQYAVKHLVWYEQHEDVESALPEKNKSRNGIELGRSS